MARWLIILGVVLILAGAVALADQAVSAGCRATS